MCATAHGAFYAQGYPIEFPPTFSKSARDIISKLLVAAPAQRLGAMKHGARDVSDHPFFAPMNFEALLSMSLPAPYVPKVQSKTDTSNFEQYEDTDGQEWPPLTMEQSESLFKAWGGWTHAA